MSNKIFDFTNQMNLNLSPNTTNFDRQDLFSHKERKIPETNAQKKKTKVWSKKTDRLKTTLQKFGT